MPLPREDLGEPAVARKEGQAMAKSSRLGNGFLLATGLALAILMAYTVALNESPGVSPWSEATTDVAVFFPDRIDWQDFGQGLSTCARRGLVKVVRELDDEVVVETPRHRRAIRFAWHRVRGRSETREEV